MGIDFSLACGDCLEFIDLHKWCISKDLANCLIADHRSLSGSNEYFQAKRFPNLSSRFLLPLTSSQILEMLSNSELNQPYIKELFPFVQNFILCHQNHFLFISCDIGEEPWDFGEPRCYEWRQVQAVFNYHSQFLPKNLIQDFGFLHWKQVLRHYSIHAPWFLHEQFQVNREALKKAFEKEVLAA